MTGDPAQDFYEPPYRPPRPVRVQATPILVVVLLLVGTLVGGYYVAKRAGWLTPVEPTAKTWGGQDGIGITSKIRYPADPPAPVTANGRDLTKEQLEALKRELDALKRMMEAFAKHQHPKEPAPAAKPVSTPAAPKPHRPMLFISNKLDRTAVVDEDRFDLAPGATKIPCVVETAMNSDVQSSFTAKVRHGIYDTKTGHHLLIPQGSTILGKYESANLVFGNERLPSLSLSVALPDGRSVDLGSAPVMDQKGMAGLVSEVNNHWGRLFGAVLVMGVLRGGQQVIAMESAGEGGAGQIASGMAGAANQVGQQKLNRAIDTRPTITVNAGELCQVLLTKPLKLAPYATHP